jgi:hypothetical protein
MYNEVTKECKCDRCSHEWISRGSKPRTCSRCTSKLWDSGNRKFDVIIAKFYGRDSDNQDRLKFGILEFIDRPTVESSDIFYVTDEDYRRYFPIRFGANSAVILIGSFVIPEDKVLQIEDINLIYAHPVGFTSYLNMVELVFNKKSVIEKQRELERKKKEEAEKVLRDKQEQERLLELAKKKIQENAGRRQEIQEAEKKVLDESIPIEERIRALGFLNGA